MKLFETYLKNWRNTVYTYAEFILRYFNNSKIIQCFELSNNAFSLLKNNIQNGILYLLIIK